MFYRFRGRLLLLAAAVAAVCVLWYRAPASGKANFQPAERTEAKYLGTASCASMACHHFNGAEGTVRSEYSTWANGDKHSRAFTVLYNDRSARMVRNLAALSFIEKKKESVEALPATQQGFCLKCHATNDGNKADSGDRFALADGVGCEACHGPAEKYITAHFQYGFKDLTPEVKDKDYGLKNTKDLVQRAQLCITCHVGDSSKEVNHDLIAAGHPRLNFELAGYHGIYHKHWSDLDEKKRNKDFYARIWVIGQLVTSKSALDLLAVRADSAEKPHDKGGRPWPEFAEYACFACHKDIRLNSSTQTSDYYKTRHPGAFPFGRWYLADLNSSLSGESGFIPEVAVKGRLELQKLMEGPAPAPKEVSAKAKQMSAALGAELKKVVSGPLAEARLSAMLTKYLDDGAKRGNELTWDEATQLYLAAAALSQGLTDLGTPTLVKGKGRDELTAVRDRLRLAFPKAEYDSPKNYDPTAKPTLADQLKAIRTQLGN